jgi:hypothetical protein
MSESHQLKVENQAKLERKAFKQIDRFYSVSQLYKGQNKSKKIKLDNPEGVEFE